MKCDNIDVVYEFMKAFTFKGENLKKNIYVMASLNC